MTGSSRRNRGLIEAIDRAAREKLDAPPEPSDVVITEEGIEENMEEASLRRAALLWRSQGWGPMNTACTRCDRQAYCAGKTRTSVHCLPCFIAGPKQKGRVMTASAKIKSLREPFFTAVREAIPTAEIVEKVAYARVVEGKKTLAYVNGDRKLKVEIVRVEAGVDPGLSITATGEIGKVVREIAKRRDLLLAPAEATKETLDETLAGEVVGTDKKTTAPDPKPGSKKETGKGTTETPSSTKRGGRKAPSPAAS